MKLEKLQSIFDSENAKYPTHFLTNQEQFNKLAPHIVQLDYTGINIDLSGESGIKFNILFDDNVMLMVKKLNSISDMEPDFNKLQDTNLYFVIYSLFKNRDLIIGDLIEINNLIVGIKNYLQIK